VNKIKTVFDFFEDWLYAIYITFFTPKDAEPKEEKEKEE
jgi:hypothetical protein